jgi:hypothetical protein
MASVPKVRGPLLAGLALACLLAMLFMAASAWAARGELRLVSRASGPAGAAGDSDSVASSISADGRYVAFESDAGNLTLDDGANRDIFRRDVRGPAPVCSEVAQASPTTPPLR